MSPDEIARLQADLYDERVRNEQLAEQVRSLSTLVTKLNLALYGDPKVRLPEQREGMS